MTQTTEEMLAERAKTHGEFSHHAGVTQALKRAMRNSPNWATLPDIMKETLDMNAHKIGRVLTGNPFTPDHWDDMIGYDRLIGQRTDASGLLPEHAETATLYAVATTTQEKPCAQSKAADIALLISAMTSSGLATYTDFYRSVAMKTHIPYDEAKKNCLALGYGQNGKKMRRRMRG